MNGLIVESAMFPRGALMGNDADRRGMREKNDENGKEVEWESGEVWGALAANWLDDMTNQSQPFTGKVKLGSLTIT